MKIIRYTLFAVPVLWFAFFKNGAVNLKPGVLAPNPPEQVNISSPQSFPFKNYSVTPLATFHLTAKILAKKKYRWGRESDLSPIDLALGWGKMSDEQILDSIDISQSNRWYRWKVKKFPIPRRELETHSANMHLVPSSKDIHSKINSARAGEIVEISGKLIKVTAPDGWRWRSSLSRTDTGSHACELFWVEEFEIHNWVP